MNWQEFEDSLMDMSQAHETPVDTDALWARLHPKKRRRFLPWFWWAIGAAGLLIAAGVYWQFRSLTDSETTLNAPQEVKQGFAPAVPATDATASVKNETTSHTQTNTVPRDAPENSSKNVQKNTKNTGFKYTSTAQIAINPNTNLQNTPAQKPLFETTTARPWNTTSGANNNTTSTQSKGMNGLSQTGSSIAPIVVPVPASGIASPQSNTQQQTAATPVFVHKNNMAFLPVDLLAVQGKQPVPQWPVFRMEANTTAPITQKAPGKPVWIGAAVDYQQWHIQEQRDTSYYEGLPRTFERNTESISASLLAQIPVTRRFTLTAGLGYQQQNFTFSRVIQWDSTYYVPVSNQYSPDYTAFDSSHLYLTQSTFTRRIVHHNRIQSWSIPLSVSYAFPLGRVQLAPYCGVQLNLFQRATGRIMGYENQPIDLTATGIYNRPWSVSVMGGLAAETALSPRTKVSLRVGVTQDLTNRTTNNQPHTERFLQYGVGIGVFRKF